MSDRCDLRTTHADRAPGRRDFLSPLRGDSAAGQVDRAPSSTPSRGAVTCPLAALALLAALASAGPAAAATVTLNAGRNGEAIDIHASAVLNADVATAWRVLTGYERYAEFIPHLRASRVVARDGATIMVEQSGDAAVWLFKVPVRVTFEIIESPPNALRSRAVAGSLPALTSSYVLVPAGSGVRLDYEGRIVPGFELLGPIEKMAVERNIAGQFRALADEIERRSANEEKLRR
jgi:hypothetical protein